MFIIIRLNFITWLLCIYSLSCCLKTVKLTPAELSSKWKFLKVHKTQKCHVFLEIYSIGTIHSHQLWDSEPGNENTSDIRSETACKESDLL